MEEDKKEPKEARMDQAQFPEKFLALQNEFIKHIEASLVHRSQTMFSQNEMMAQHNAEFINRQMQKLEALQDILNKMN